MMMHHSFINSHIIGYQWNVAYLNTNNLGEHLQLQYY